MNYYEQEVKDILESLKSSSQGLTEEEGQERLKRDGRNELVIESGIKPWLIFLHQFKSFIIYILLFAVVVSVVIGEFIDSSIILAILVVNAFIGFFQELSAQKSLEALKRLEPLRATVIRKGARYIIDAVNLVVGDIVYLQSGDKVPADCRIIEATRFQVEESLLTGESLPTEKKSSIVSANASIGDQHNMVFSSTSVVNGHAKAVVTATGMNTEVGKITELVASSEAEETPLQRRLSVFGKKLGLVIIAICIIIFTMLVLKAGLAGEVSSKLFVSYMFITVSLAVAAVPTALPAVVTIALSIGVKRLLDKKALVRQLSSVETLGSCDVICTDKTGTLTQNQMTVRYGWTLDGEAELSGIGYEPKGNLSRELSPLLFQAGLFCNNASLEMKSNGWHHYGNPTEVALLVSSTKAGITDTATRLDEMPFSSERKLMSVLVRDESDKTLIFTKGAPDQLLQHCTHILQDGKRVPLDSDLRHFVLDQNDAYGEKAMRVLAFAYKEVKEKVLQESNLVFIGLQAMIDPPRKDVIEAIAKTEEAGIRVVMMTGDYPATAKAIGDEIGISGDVCSGDALNRMDDNQLQEALAAGINIFARVAPEHKQRIVTVLQHLGYTVAMTGDGINDGPALKRANVGIAVGSGTEVAKEASDFILLDDSFSHIVNAIEEGRGIYDNIQKSIMLLLSGNLGEVLIIFLAVLFGWHLPLTAILLLWINMVTDGAPALAFSLDPYGEDIMRRKPKNREENILPGPKLTLITVLGSVGTIFALALFSLYGGSLETNENLIIAQTMVFHFVILYEMVLVFVIRRSYQVNLLSNSWVWAAVVFAIGLQLLLNFTPANQIFKISQLSLQDIGVLAVASLLFWLVTRLYQLITQK